MASFRKRKKNQPQSRGAESKFQPAASNQEIIWGIHPVFELLNNSPRRVSEITVLKGKSSSRIQQIIDGAGKHHVKIKFRNEIRIPGAGQVNHQGVCARIMAIATLDLEELVERLKPIVDPVLLVLDSIQDPHNLGAIVRSASAAGVSGMIVNKDRSAPLGGTASKISAGALEHVPVCRTTNLTTALQRLKKEGFWIYGTAASGSQSIYQTDFSGPVCLVMGGEEKGIRPLVQEQCDVLVSIPMHGALDSLNVSVAAGVVLFEIIRQRRMD